MGGDKQNDKRNEEMERKVMLEEVRLQVIVAVFWYVMFSDVSSSFSDCIFRVKKYRRIEGQ